MSYVHMYGHVVIRTKCSERTIPLQSVHSLFNYICAICSNKGCPVLCINGMEEHIHILIDFLNEPPRNLIRDIKSYTSKWIRTDHRMEFPNFMGFGKEYFCSSVSPRNKDAVIEYIKNQRIHHTGPHRESFEMEMRKIMAQAGYDSVKANYFLNPTE